MAGSSTVIDSLVIELGLDSSKFTRDQRDAIDNLRRFEDQAQRSGSNVESQTKKIFGFLTDIKRQTLTGLGLFFGGTEIAKMINAITTLDASTGRFARTLGMTAEETSAWQGAIKQVGGSAESANAALGGLSGEMSRFVLTGQSSILPVLSRLGISLFDQNRHLKTAGEMWLELSDAVQGMDPRRARAFLEMIPGANQDMINFALLGRKAMEQYLEASREAGVTTKEAAEEAAKYQKNLSLLDQAAMNLGRSLVNFLAPALINTMNLMRSFLQGLQIKPGSEEAAKVHHELRGQTMQKFGTPRDFLNWMRDHDPFGPENWDKIGDALYGKGKTGAEGFEMPSGVPGSTGNMSNFLNGLSYLETSFRNTGNAASSATGFFQFLSGTRNKAIGAGLGDPWAGGYDQQKAVADAFIRRFYPKAAAAIDRGDYATASRMLTNEWPSLPGGSQPQSQRRYGVFNEELAGKGPMSPSTMAPGVAAGGSSNSTVNHSEVNVGDVHITTTANTADGIAQDLRSALKRGLDAGAANYSQQ